MQNNLFNAIDVTIQNMGTPSKILIFTAFLATASTIIAALITGVVTWISNSQKLKHEKQWAYICKRSSIIENAIDVILKMMFTKLLIADHDSKDAKGNFFTLQKDALFIESQLVLFASLEIAEKFYNFKNKIILIPPQDMRARWEELYKEGGDLIRNCRQYLGNNMNQKFEKFTKELIVDKPPQTEEILGSLASTTLGSSTIADIKFLTESIKNRITDEAK